MRQLGLPPITLATSVGSLGTPWTRAAAPDPAHPEGQVASGQRPAIRAGVSPSPPHGGGAQGGRSPDVHSHGASPRHSPSPGPDRPCPDPSPPPPPSPPPWGPLGCSMRTGGHRARGSGLAVREAPQGEEAVAAAQSGALRALPGLPGGVCTHTGGCLVTPARPEAAVASGRPGHCLQVSWSAPVVTGANTTTRVEGKQRRLEKSRPPRPPLPAWGGTQLSSLEAETWPSSSPVLLAPGTSSRCLERPQGPRVQLPWPCPPGHGGTQLRGGQGGGGVSPRPTRGPVLGVASRWRLSPDPVPWTRARVQTRAGSGPRHPARFRGTQETGGWGGETPDPGLQQRDPLPDKTRCHRQPLRGP